MTKQQQILDRLTNIERLQERMTVSVEEHVRRTNLLEEQIAPIQRHVHRIEGALQFTGGLCVLAGAALAIFRILHGFF